MRHLVDPALLPGLNVLPALELSEESLPALRASLEQMTGAAPEPGGTGVEWRVTDVIAADGRRIPVRIYSPVIDAIIRPAILHIHGGGYVLGSVSSCHAQNMELAKQIDAVVVSVDYRLAPETRAPGAVEDCYAALCWLNREAEALAIDPLRIGVRGESAGGGLAAALCLLARDRKGPAIAHQNLVYPMLDDRTCKAVLPEHFGAFIWTASANTFGWRALLGGEPGATGISSYAAAARATDLSGLPPAFIAVGALDLFLLEDIDYARRLLGAGVATELHVYPGAYHGFDILSDAPAALRLQEDAVAALRRALAVGVMDTADARMPVRP